MRILRALLVILFFTACKKDSKQEMVCPDFGYENGYQIGNSTVHYYSSGNNFTALAVWTSSNTVTTLIINGPMINDSSLQDEMTIQFYGKQTGTYTIIPYGSNGNPISANQAIMWLTNQGPFVSYSGTLEVTEYDSQGGKICRSFSGDYVHDTTHLFVSNGAFLANVQ